MKRQKSLPHREANKETTSVDDPSTVLAVLADEHAREILSATGYHPQSAEELVATCDLSLSTIYRKVDRLVELGLLAEQFQPSTEGRHRREYQSNVDSLELTYTSADQFTLKITWRDRDTY